MNYITGYWSSDPFLIVMVVIVSSAGTFLAGRQLPGDERAG